MELVRSMRQLLRILVVFLPLISCADQWPFPPSTISTPGQNASGQQVAVDLNGNVVAVWIENGVVQATSGTANSGWSMTNTPISGMVASAPQVVIDQNGNATA